LKIIVHNEGGELFNEGNGKSNEKGFRVIDTERGITVETKYFREGRTLEDKTFELKLKPGVSWRLCLITLIIAGLLVFLTELPFWAIIVSIFSLQLFLLLLAFFGPVIIYLVKNLFEVWGNKELREWHGCEHKVATLLIEGMEPTIENLQRVSRIHPACGMPWWPIQYFITTREPSPEKLKEGIELAKEYYNKADMSSGE